jgi:hypothetical protein
MKISIYFLFYVAMILELLIFIVDRDTAEEIVDKSAVSMIEQMSSVDTVKMFGALGFTMGGADSTQLVYYPFKLISFFERDSVRYIVGRTYRDKFDNVVGGFQDTTNLDGSLSVATDTVRVMEAGIRKEMYVRNDFARDPTTGDLHMKVVHGCPMGAGGRINYQKAYVFGSVEVEVKAMLKRRFPDAVLANPRLIAQLQSRYKFDINNYYPKCDPARTKIAFRPTENVVQD